MTRAIAVIGGGNGALTVAGAAALAGHRVRVWDRFLADHPKLLSTGQIRMRGAVSGDARIELPRDDLAWTISGAELIEVVVPGFALAWVASALMPLLSPGQMVLLHPGGTGGALEVAHLWDDFDLRGDITLGVADTLAYATRLEDENAVHVHAEKKFLLVAAADARRTPEFLEVVSAIHPQASPGTSLLEVALANLNPIIHPPITLLNAGRIESGQSFSLYGEGATRSASSLIETLDRERLTLAEALGVPSTPLKHWVERAYGVAGPTIGELFARLDKEVYRGLRAPTSLNSRYLTEDIPLGLETLVELAAQARVDLPVTESVVRISRLLLNKMGA